MKRALIATIDAAKARIWLYQEQTNPGFELTEIADLDNPGRRLADRDLYSETRPGLKGTGGLRRTTVGGSHSDQGAPGAGSDYHRDAHRDEMDGRFAKLIVDELDDQVTRRKLGHLVVCASPRMLGTLRTASGALHRDGLVFEEIDKDLSNLTTAQLHDYLANAGIVPGRQRRVAAR
jgi:protein required for attachment to host cells